MAIVIDTEDYCKILGTLSDDPANLSICYMIQSMVDGKIKRGQLFVDDTKNPRFTISSQEFGEFTDGLTSSYFLSFFAKNSNQKNEHVSVTPYEHTVLGTNFHPENEQENVDADCVHFIKAVAEKLDLFNKGFILADVSLKLWPSLRTVFGPDLEIDETPCKLMQLRNRSDESFSEFLFDWKRQNERFSVGSLKQSDAELVAQNWSYKTECNFSLQWIRWLIENYPSIGVRNSEGKLVSWELTYQTGAACSKFTLAEHRNRSHGKLLSETLVRQSKVCFPGLPRWSTVLEHNKASLCVFQKLSENCAENGSFTWMKYRLH